MTPKEISDVLIKIATMHTFTKEENYEIIGRLTEGLLSTGKPTDPKRQPEVLQPADKVEYTPQQSRPSVIVIPKGHQCVCEKCKCVAHTIVDDVLDGMKRGDFCACFLPRMGDDAQLWFDRNGNVATDCVLCGGVKTVWLKDKGEAYIEVPDSMMDEVRHD